MPRYFFHVSDGSELPDHDGVELPGPGAARRQATALLGRLMAAAPEDVWNGDDWQVRVEDQSGLVLFSIHIVTVDAASPRGPAGTSARPN